MFCWKFLLLRYCHILLRLFNNRQSNRKYIKGARFLKHRVIQFLIKLLLFFKLGKLPGGTKITEITNLFGSEPYSGNNTIVQQNRIKSLHHNGNPLKQKRRCSNIPGRLHQLASCPIRSRTEEHPCWLGRGTPPQSGRIHPVYESPAYLITLLVAANSAYCYHYYY